MKLYINGILKEFKKDKMTISDLIKELQINAPNFAVAVGFEVIPKSEYDTYLLKDGDKVEIVHFVGGG